jgi:hypothetical protein
VLLCFNFINARYLIEVQGVGTLSGGNTYTWNQTASPLNFQIVKCTAGTSNPQEETDYVLTWYSNSINATTGGTVMNAGLVNQATLPNLFNETKSFVPPTNVIGTRYYYAVLTSPSSTLCGFTTSLTTNTQQVTVNNSVTAPSNILLSATAINENVPANSTVGILSTTDADYLNTFTYELVTGAGSADNTAFNIIGNSLRITNSPDFETKSSYDIRLKTTDQGGLSYEKQFNITINNLCDVVLTAASQTNISCNGGSNGAASVNTPTGGTGPYTYNWTPGNPTGDGTTSVTGLTAGTWTCTVTDANSCTATRAFTITQPTALSVTAASKTNISCNGGNNGAASVNTPTGGTGPYTYNWTPGNPTGDGTASVTGLTEGTWTCTVTDANSCTAFQNFTISQPTALAVTPASQTNVSCNGGTNGTASVNLPTGGTAPYTYDWTPGTPTGDGTRSVTGLFSRVWTCRVTDANGCFTTQTFNITTPTSVSTSTGSQTNVTCFGGSNGSATANGSGGTSPYTYLWSNGNTTATASNLIAGTYTLIVTDANGCNSLPRSFTITQPASALTATATQTNVTCFGGNNGAINVTLSGGTSPYTYNWGGGITTEDRTNLTAGTYSCTITDANSCTSTLNFTITQPSTILAPTVTTPVTYTINDTASALTATTGGTGLAWYASATSTPALTSAPTPTTTTAGTTSYWVASTAANGCESTRVEIVVIVNQPANYLHFDGVNDFVSCGNILPQSYTKEALVNIASGTSAINNFISGGGSDGEHAFWAPATNGFKLAAGHNGAYTAVQDATALDFNTWYHVAVTYDAPTTTMKLYKNGSLVATNSNLAPYNSGNSVRLGAFNNSGNLLKGNLDEVRIWNAARTADQINSSKNCELQGSETGLVGYYKFNQGNDASNNTAVTTLTATTGPNGTLTGFTLTGATSNFLAGSPVTTGSVIPSVPTVTTPVVYNQNDAATALTATTGGTGLLWYTAATGVTGTATAPKPITTAVGTTSYWVASTNANGCESARVEIVVTVNALVPATHLNFDGTDDHISIPPTAINNLPQGTISAWVYTNALTSQTICAKQSDFENSYALFMIGGYAPNGKIYYQSKNTATPLISSATLATGQWYHLAVTFDNTQAKLYINGVLDNTVTGDFSLPDDVTVTATTIGSWLGSGGGQYFNGRIDEFRVWNVALTPEQVNGTKNCELQGNETGLVSYYKFNQGFDASNNTTITTVTDATSNANNGTLTGFALTASTSNFLAGSPVTTGSVIPSVPTVTTPVVYNQNDTATALTATTGANGTGLLWYTAAAGGTGDTTAPSPSTANVGSTSYWVASTNANGCESARVEIVVTVNALVPANYLHFDGVNDYVALPTSAVNIPSGNSPYTIEAMINPSAMGEKHIVAWGNYGSQNQVNAFRLTDNGLVNYWWAADFSVPYSFNLTNTWYHVAATYDGSVRSIYVDGVLIGSDFPSANSHNVTNTSNVTIGAGNNYSGFFNGGIDEVRIWNVARSTTEINNKKACELDGNETGLVAYYKFNQGNSGANNTTLITATSTTGNNVGTLTGFGLTAGSSNWLAGSTIVSGNTCTTLGNENFEVGNNLKMYPNPAQNIVNIEVQNLDNTSVEVYDINGRQLFTQKLNNTTNTVNIEKFAVGVYMFKVSSSQGTATSKVVKQ